MGSLHPRAVIATLLATVLALAPVLSSHPRAEAAAGDDAVILSSCDDAADFSPARTPDQPHFDFAAWEALPFSGASHRGDSLRWHLHPSGGTSSARLSITRTVRGSLNAISVWVKNPNAHDVTLRLEILDADGARYTSEPVALVDEKGWREVAFNLQAMSTSASDPCPGLDAPFTRTAFLLEGLSADRPHTIYLDEMAARAGGVASVTVSDMRCQTSVGRGEQLPVSADLSPASPAHNAGISARLTTTDGGVLAQVPLRITESGADTASARAKLPVPRWLQPGRYEVQLASTFASLTGTSTVNVAVGGSRRDRRTVAIDADLSPPAIRSGGEAQPPVIEELRGSLPAELSEEANIVAVPATTGAHPFSWAGDALDAAGSLDFSSLNRRVASVLNARPESLVILQVFLNAPPAWTDAHPELLQHFTGNTLAPPGVFAVRRHLPDVASRRWRADAQKHLRELLRHVANAPWGHRVVGYELQAGDLGAWRPWGASLGLGDDTTQARHRAFLRWMHETYPDVEELRRAWLGRRRGFGRPRAGFASVEIPLPLEDAPEPSLYDPAADQPMIDLLHFRAEVMAEAVVDMATTVHEEAGSDVLVGACYGHLRAQARGNDWSWPHTALTGVVESGKLDFLSGPQWRLDGPSHPSSLGDSVRRAGLLYLERPGIAATVADACGVIVPAGASPSRDAMPRPDTPGDGPAVIEVIDDRSARYLSGDGLLPRELLASPMADGIAHRTHLLRDLLAGDRPSADAYIFRNLFTITPERGRRLARNTCRDGSLLIWVYAPGAIDRNLITGRTMKYLTGIRLTPLTKRGKLIVEPESDLLEPFGFARPVSPWFISADEDAEWLGTVRGGSRESCGFALREFDGCTSVFTAAPPTEDVIRHLADRAGIDFASTSY